MTGQLDSLLAQLDALCVRAIKQLDSITTSEELSEWDRRYLGRKSGELASLRSMLETLSKDERRVLGQKYNAVKAELEGELAAKREALHERELVRAMQQEHIDVTLPGRALPVGHMHPISRTIAEVVQIFEKMAFSVAEGPEVETDYYNFQALNFLVDHPARDMQDTLWVVPGEILLRTQTSPMQIRVMERVQPPIRIIAPGKVYRNEAIDATHEAMFHQIEGLLVDEDCTMSDLKGCLERFVQEMFGEGHRVRFRGSYFPFTEPSAEVDMDCPACYGKGCLRRWSGACGQVKVWRRRHAPLF
jgi:phenylalanyl-tRNA synthetase alpha chain